MNLCQHSIRGLLLSLFLGAFLLTTLPIGINYVNWGHLPSIVCFLGFQVICLGACYDLAEVILALLLKKQELPKLSKIPMPPKAAILYTTCNDAIAECLEELRNQTYTNYDIFVLDDSTDKKYQKMVETFGYKVIRRKSRKGFKAGNLNNWLLNYGASYKYFVIADCDSKFPETFLEEMINYAEHPSNSEIAIFQSKIAPWNTSNHFARTIGILAKSRMHILERVANQLDMVLSFGHNNLLRTYAVRAVEGFNEQITPEDTAITLSLSALGFKCKLVDILSYEAEPTNIFSYTKRTIRWAKQTIEVFRLPWHNSSLTLKLVVCRHLQSYAVSFVYPLLLIISIWGFKTNLNQVIFSINYIIHRQLYIFLIFLFLPLFITGVTLLLHLMVAAVYNVNLITYLKHSLLCGAIMNFSWFPLSKELIKSVMGGKTVFSPTNAYTKDSIRLRTIFLNMKPTILLSLFLIIGLIINPVKILINFNFLWILLLISSPLLLWYFQREINE